MDSASVCFSRPYFVNAPLVLDSTNSNTDVVKANVQWCKDLLQSSHDLLPKDYIEFHSSNYYDKLPNYSNIVRYHIDVYVLQEKLEKSVYYCVQDFINDIELMWSNAINYFTKSKEELRTYSSKRDAFREYVNKLSDKIKTTQTIKEEHCIFCGATSYPKYPLIECSGKCGRKSHLHCGQIVNNEWKCIVCSKDNVESQQREKAFIHLLSSFKQMKNKTKELSVCNK